MATSLPAMNTVLVPLVMLSAKQVFGYGMTTGPAGGAGGLQHGSGNAWDEVPSLPTALQAIS